MSIQLSSQRLLYYTYYFYLNTGNKSNMTIKRLHFDNVENSERVFTDEFNEFLIALHDKLGARVLTLRENRDSCLKQALAGKQPTHLPPSVATTENWTIDPIPDELRTPGIEISGPSSIRPMLINALNPAKDGDRAEGDLDDDEDSGGHRLIDTVNSAINRLEATLGTLEHYDSNRDKRYQLQPGKLPFFMHRERGLHLDEPDVTIDGKPISASILGTALTIFHAGREQIKKDQTIYFYVPKLESALEARWYRDLFDAATEHLDIPKSSIKAIALVESLPLVYQMEEVLYELGPYAAGLNAARWDLKASIFEFIMADPDSVWPDRFGVAVPTTKFLANIFRRLVAICLKHNAVAIGGMATPLPSRDPEVNESASKSIRGDKEWEAKQGFLRAWVAHIFHMQVAAEPFKKWHSGWQPTEDMKNPDNYPVSIEVPEGPVTIEGTRRNVRMVIEYLEGWLNGRGAKGIDSLEGQSGIHPALMEDLATGRMSVAQIAQRIIHAVKGSDTGEIHNYDTVKKIVKDQLDDILRIREESGVLDSGMKQRYEDAFKITLKWIKNYTEYNFRSLGTYTHEDLKEIAIAPSAF